MSFYFWYVSFDIDMGIFVLGDCGALNIRHIDRTVLPRISWLAGGEYAVHHTYVGRLVPEAEKVIQSNTNQESSIICLKSIEISLFKVIDLRFRQGNNSWREWVHALPLGIL
jgi:hypothetical protein